MYPEYFMNEAMRLQDFIVENRRELHKIPEIGLDLFKTREYLMTKLRELELEPVELGDGIVVNIGDPKKGKTILLRGDMDALPIEEEADIDFKATNGNMHACGHDIHASMLLAAAQILKQVEESLEGNVKLMFQPGEETLSGAKRMIEVGILENPKVDAAMMIHSFTGFEQEPGRILVPKSGAATLAPDEFHINIKGRGGHGAMPEKSVDPLNIACHTHIALQELVSREIKPSEKALCVVGHLSGGKASNVVADTAKLIGCIRTTNEDTRQFMKRRLEEICEGTAKTFRGSASVEYTLECPSAINDEKMRDFGIDYAETLIGKENVGKLGSIMDDDMLNGSEDFAYISREVPSFIGILTAGNAEEGFKYPHHNPKTIFDESKLYVGAAYYSYFAFKWLQDNK
ncbi:Peptidase dimerisation domain-containing protein [Dethiosulfatibacter aminovorans DSM 17477]|uniref:Peptidase dimerisation domain-containing protein n=1 Tax=Dethiosulfatibacter aminovorans DSM 17477 TaxID=1121476 RepID=A0A1M6N1M6_9FIRM|nr:M20 family metallopeptidase [Dethiosulfatibacter aminovorans]SHJ89590.1 Peptidase dimerisation domain-containing protein [Dethiosulfatibacter aminovorans DSM 17477]